MFMAVDDSGRWISFRFFVFFGYIMGYTFFGIHLRLHGGNFVTSFFVFISFIAKIFWNWFGGI